MAIPTIINPPGKIRREITTVSATLDPLPPIQTRSIIATKMEVITIPILMEVSITIPVLAGQESLPIPPPPILPPLPILVSLCLVRLKHRILPREVRRASEVLDSSFLV